VQFKRLRLSGFKSFVEPTEFLIEPGLTGVVGPNGCGKSNLLEALRWVMGENSPKRMRGEMMDDVIFSGTEKRPARNLAEVTLLIENDDHRAPSPFTAEDELDVSRWIEREAGSTFRINAKEVRAKDVQLLFADSATGPTSPAMVSQGKISALINAKPEDRRIFLEEAAGITGLHVRRKEAEVRLKAAAANLQRLDDIMVQMAAQADSLKKQARQASRYKNIAGHIRKTQAALYFVKWKGIEEALAEAKKELDAAERQVAAATGKVANANAASERFQQALPPLRQDLAEKAAAHTRLKIAFEALDAEERSLKTRLSELRARLAQLEQDRVREQANVADSAKRIEAQAAEAKTLRAAVAAEQAGAGDVEERYRAARGETEKTEAAFEQRDSSVTAKKFRSDHIREELRFLEARKKRVAEEKDAVEGEWTELKRKAPAADGTALKALTQLSEALKAAETHLREAEEKREAATSAFGEMREKASEMRASVAALGGEIGALERLLHETVTDGKPAIGKALAIEPGFEAALGAALGEDLEVPESGTGPVGWRTLPPLTGAPALPAGVSALTDFVKAPLALARRLSQVGVIEENKGEAMMKALHPGQRLVSKEGTLWRWDGLVRTAKAPTWAALQVLYKTKLEALTDEKQALEKILSAHAVHLAKAEASARTLRAEEDAARQACRTANDAFRAGREKTSSLEQGALKTAERAAALSEARSRLDKDLGEIEEKETTLREEAKSLDISADEAEALEAAKAALEAARGKLSSVRGKFETWRELKAEKEARIASLENESAAWAERRDAATAHIGELEARKVEAEKALGEIDQNPARFEERRQGLLDQMAGTEAASAKARETLEQAEAEAQDKARALKEAEKELGTVREEMVRRQAAAQGVEERKAELSHFVQEEFGCLPEGILDLAEMTDKEKANLPPVEVSEGKLERLKAERERLGAVNLRADVELQELEAETARLTRERGELEEAIRKLRSSISSLNREGREKLLEAFATVNKNFGDLFAKIFNGGKAHLVLTEGEDPLEAGLEIMASPPGKKLLHRSLLSGGEQALTAITLIFAVFLTNPAPICVLDEVDAPLDDANVERFCDLVDEINSRTHTRFVIATHNAITMSRMERLYGVTMPEQGVSQLVSVNLQRAEQLRALA
jgi:chromosome segregation protein